MTRDGNIQVVYLKAGEMHFGDKPSLVITVLGSCLSVTMFDRRTGAGGICHGLLPACENRTACLKTCRQPFRYVDCSIRQMLLLFERRGSHRRDIEVKCFGGADMFTRPIEKKGVVSVGRQNIMTAEAALSREGFRIVKQDVGGLGGRKVFFYTHTGEVLLKRLTRTAHHAAAGGAARSRTETPAIACGKGGSHDQ